MATVDREAIIARIDDVPSFNATVTKVIALSNDPMSQPKDLITTISLDPVLTASILKLINSAYFGMGGNVVSLNRAVVMLGLNTVKNVAISTSLLSNIKMRNDFKYFTSDEFWEHSLACAVGAKLIATRMGVPAQEREEYFIAGLLHDIGKVILVQYFSDEYAEVMNPEALNGRPVSKVEQEQFGINHAELGGLMAEKWELPEILTTTVARHHSPNCEGEECNRVSMAVHLSDLVCNRKSIGIKVQKVTEKLAPNTLEVLGLEKGDLLKAFENLEEKVEDAKIFLNH